MKQSDQLAELLKRARQRITALELGRHQEIAVIGMGCRFPGKIDRIEKLWEALCLGKDCLIEVPSDRWNKEAFYHSDPEAPGKLYVRKGGFVDQIDCFDYQFFGIPKREADAMDPQQRMVLETTWHALENARLSKKSLQSCRAGIFIGQSWHDYEINLQQLPMSAVTAHTGLGNMRSVTAGRLAHWLGAKGPAMVIDTACSSSLVAIHQGVMSLRQGESDLVIAGGVSLMLSPRSMVFCCKLKALSPTDRSQPFAEYADGYVRGEGCGIVVLKRLAQAVADGDSIVAVIKGSAVNHDGQTTGLTVPSREAQVEVITVALKDARVASTAVDYIEAHGVGTRLGDPIEVGALTEVFSAARKGQKPLYLGSIKANMGHLEAAAGVAGFIKTALMIQKKKVLPQIQNAPVSTHISWEMKNIVMPHSVIEWAGDLRVAGVSAFSISGTNAHVILGSVGSAADVKVEPSPIRYHSFSRHRCWFEKRSLFYQSRWREVSGGRPEETFVAGKNTLDRMTLLLIPAFFDDVLIDLPASKKIILGCPEEKTFQSCQMIKTVLATLEEQTIEVVAVFCQPFNLLAQEVSWQTHYESSYQQALQTLMEVLEVLKILLHSGKTIHHCVFLTMKNDCSLIKGSVSSLLRCVMLEAPLQFLHCDCVEVDATENLSRVFKEVVNEKTSSFDRVYRENQYWLKEVTGLDQEMFYFDETLLASCLNEKTALPLQKAYQRQAFLPSNKAYLITGGLGSLGQVAAYCLALLGARHLILLGRKRRDSLQRLSQKLRALGVKTVTFLSVDVSSLTALQAALSSVEKTVPRIDGVIHAAGECHDHLITHICPSELRRTYGAKVLGALHLHHLLKETSFFIAYSSTAGVCGAAGQGSYAAANAALTALICQRLTAGQSATAIAWGPWEIGMTEDLTSAQRHRLQQRGFHFLSAYEGIKALATVIVQQLEGEIIIADAATEVFNKSSATSVTTLQEPMNYLLTILAQMTGLPQDSIDREIGLIDLGLDSLMLLEFQMTIEQDWHCQLGPSFLFDYPTVQDIERYLLGFYE